MNIWKILGIEETRDKKEIKKAYKAKLPDVNPEDDQEAFMKLREAYETALKYADGQLDNDDETKVQNSQEQSYKQRNENPEIDAFTDELESLYNSFYRRIDTGEWEKLLSSPVCIGLDTKDEAKHALLTFMMDKYLVPCDVIRLIDSHFGFAESQEELFEIYPPAFIQQVILNAINGSDTVPYNLFQVEDVNGIEEFFPRYRKLKDAIYNNELDDARNILKEIEDSGVGYPYV